MAPTAELGRLIAELQSYGVQIARGPDSVPGRTGGAGPSDAGMIRVEGVQVTFPFTADYVSESPFSLKEEAPDGAWGVYRDGQRLATAEVPPRPRFYDLTTADGIPYWKIALLHLDTVASPVNQTCAYWGNADQCAFCGIGVTLANGRTIAR
ncbi:MAG: MSMEG_0568 family radical SAM protein, partial [Actinomycetota bacterium]